MHAAQYAVAIVVACARSRSKAAPAWIFLCIQNFIPTHSQLVYLTLFCAKEQYVILLLCFCLHTNFLIFDYCIKGNFGGGKLRKITFGKLSPVSTAVSDTTRNWQAKLWQIHWESPNSSQFSPTKISTFPYLACRLNFITHFVSTGAFLPTIETPIFVSWFYQSLSLFSLLALFLSNVIWLQCKT